MSELLGVLADFVLQATYFSIGSLLMKTFILGKMFAKGSYFSEVRSVQATPPIGLAILVIAMMATMRQLIVS